MMTRKQLVEELGNRCSAKLDTLTGNFTSSDLWAAIGNASETMDENGFEGVYDLLDKVEAGNMQTLRRFENDVRKAMR